MTGFDPLTAAATAGLYPLVIDIIKGQGSNVITRFLNQDIGKAAQQAYFDASKKYVENYAERHCSLKVLGMREPVSLESVYTTVQVLDCEDRGFASVEDLEQAFRETPARRFRFTKDSKKDGLEIAIAKQYLMVLGAPGSGKSTFLRKMGLEALKGKKGGFKKHRCIPVLLELKRFTEAKVDLKKLITTEFQVCGFPNDERFAQKALEQGKLLILLDGLDEVPSVNRDNVIESIQDFVDQYDKNRYITSCRTAVSHRNLRRFTDVTVAEFDDNQIQQFISNWFKSEVDWESGTAERCWKLLQQSENAAAKELAHTPLLLTFLCLVYDRSQTFSNNRSTLYRKALRILLEEWAAEKRIMHQEIYQGLNMELEEVLLSEIASKSFAADRLFLPQGELVDQIKTFLASNLNIPKQISGEAVINEIAVQQGILVERAEAVYSFSHLTLQEYLTAQYIVDNTRIKPLVKHLSARRWREVFLLVSGLIRSDNGADELLQTMNQVIQTYTIGIPRLQALLQWINRVIVPSAESRQFAAKRAFLLGFALALNIVPEEDRARALSKAEARILALDSSRAYNASVPQVDSNRALDLTLALKLARELDQDFSLELARALELARELARARELAHDLARAFSVISSALNNALNNAQVIAQSLTCASPFVEIDFARFSKQLKELQITLFDLELAAPSKIAQFSGQLLQFYCNTFKLNSASLNLTLAEQDAIGTCLYMTKLMVQCQQEASRVSPQTWEAILATMLLPAPTPETA